MKVAIFDADVLPYIVCHNKKDSNKVKTLNDCIISLNSFINNIMKATNATHYIMALTCGGSFRNKYNPEYKSNRKYVKIDYLEEVKNYLVTEYKAVFHYGELEADDICNICIKYSSNDVRTVPIAFIVSQDKDLLMLEGTHFNPRKMEWVTTSKQQALDYFWTTMITGDTIDGVKGIEGYGKVRAKKILEEDRFKIIDNITHVSPHHSIVMMNYMDKYGEYEGIKNFAKNYVSLKILDKYDGFKVPEPIKFEFKNVFEEKDNKGQ